MLGEKKYDHQNKRSYVLFKQQHISIAVGSEHTVELSLPRQPFTPTHEHVSTIHTVVYIDRWEKLLDLRNKDWDEYQ